MNISKIYVTNYAGHDISKAFEYADSKIQVNITEGNVDVFNIDRLIYVIKQKLRDSKSNDFLLLCGATIINCIVFSQWLKKHKIVHLLLYQAREKTYILREITQDKMYAKL